jgi:hypothetical protein
VVLRGILSCFVLLKKYMCIAWYTKVFCGVEEVYVMLRGILTCFVVLKKYIYHCVVY